jgi:two-component system, NtrC family, sensor histidine kinase GlrK
VRYPQSFLKLLLVGFTLVAAPLVVALVTSGLAVDRLANRSQTTVYQAVRATQSSWRLSELLRAMERSARQIVILGDRGLLDDYRISRAIFLQTAKQFDSLPFDTEQRRSLDAILGGEQQIYDALTNHALKPASLEAQVSKFLELSYRAREITDKSAELIDREVETMRSAAAEAQRIMLYQGLALIPVIIFLVVGFTILISRPIREIDAAINGLGEGKFNIPIAVSGPQDLERLGGRLEWMRQQLVDLERQKSRFLQQLSHELKTPLTALREAAQLLSDEVLGKLTAEQREIAQILRSCSLELQRRIEELLSYGAIQSHRLNLELGGVGLRGIVERVARDHKVALQARNIAFAADVDDLTIVADAEKLRVILDNLLSNAVKFSPEGGTVSVTIRKEDDHVVMDVVDQGPGILAADAARIFEPFYQGRIEGSGPVKGTGLGLSVVKEYVVAHGGSVQALAVGGASGAHFRVRLPLEQKGPS